MKRFDVSALLLMLAVSASAFGQGQRARVRAEYDQERGHTHVAANVLYLLNTPEQFVELQLRGQYWGKRLLFTADEVSLEFYSFSAAAKYRDEKSRRLVAVLDGKEFDLGPATYKTISADKAGELLPKNARLSGKPLLEVLIAKVEPAHASALADARRVEFRLSDLRLALDDEHMSILREFNSFVNLAPGAAIPSGEGVEALMAELPPALKDAQINTTLKWLEESLFKHAVFSRNGYAWRLVPTHFSDCKIAYRIAQKRALGAVGPPSVTVFSVDLADLDAESVRAVSYDGMTYVYLRTRGGEQKIRSAWPTDADHGFTRASTTITLDDAKAAPGITAALAQAVRLCQAKP
jgi:hypothetical protein